MADHIQPHQRVNEKSNQMIDDIHSLNLYKDDTIKTDSITKKLGSFKQSALGALSINVNNAISDNIYSACIILDGLLIAYVPCIFLHARVTSTEIADFDEWEYQLTYPEPLGFLITNLIIFLWLLILQIMIITISQVSSYENTISTAKSSTLSRIASAMLVFQRTFMLGPIMDFVFHTLLISMSSTGLVGTTLALAIINIIMLLFDVFFTQRLSFITFQCFKVPQSQLKFTENYIQFMFKVIIVGVYVLLSKFDNLLDDYLYIFTILILFMMIAYSINMMMQNPREYMISDTVKRFKDWTIIALFMAILFTYVIDVKQSLTKVVVLIFIFIIGMNIFHMTVKQFFINRLENNDRHQTFKSIQEYFNEFQILQNLITNISGTKQEQDHSITELLTIIEIHQDKCSKKGECICQYLDSMMMMIKRCDKQNLMMKFSNQEMQFINQIEDMPLFDLKSQIQSYLLQGQNVMNLELYNVNNTKHQQDEEVKQFTIDGLKLKQSYFSHFAKLTYEKALHAYPKSNEIKLFCAYFALFYLRNIYLCLNILSEVQYTRLGWLEKSNLKMNKLYLIYHAYVFSRSQGQYQAGFKNNQFGIISTGSSSNGYEKSEPLLDPTYFIQLNSLQSQLNSKIQQLSGILQSFWGLLRHEDFRVSQSIDLAYKIAEIIARQYQIFKDIDSLCKQKNHKIYYSMAIVQKTLFNDMSSYNLYMNKMKSIIDIKKLINNNDKYNIDQNAEYGIVQVDGKRAQFGKIMFYNQEIVNILDQKGLESLKNSYIESSIPKILQKHWKQFVDDFFTNGDADFLNKRVSFFILNKYGYIKPVQIVLRYYYTIVSGHSFMGFIQPQKSIHFQSNNQLYDERYVLILICDNIDGRIYDINSACRKILKLQSQELQNSYYVEGRDYLTLDDIFPTLDPNEIRSSNEKILSGSLKVDLNAAQILTSTSQVNGNIKVQKESQRFGTYQIFKESFENNKYQFNIVNIVLERDMPSSKAITTGDDQKHDLDDNMQFKDVLDEESKLEETLEHASLSQSSVALSNSESGDIDESLKSKYTQMEKKTPRMLMIIIQFMIVIFVTMVVISTINFDLTKQHQLKLSLEIDMVKNSYERVVLVAELRLFLTNMIFMANGFEFNQSSIVTNRYKSYKTLLNTKQLQLRTLETTMENSYFGYSPTFYALVQSSYIILENLDQYNQQYLQNQSISFAINTLSDKLGDIYALVHQDLVGNLSIQTIYPAKDPYSPTDNERLVYWAVYNAFDDISTESLNLATEYQTETQEHALSLKQSTLITIIVSIAAIVVVGMIVTPIVSKILDKQYQAIQFFAHLDNKQLKLLIGRTNECYNMFENQGYISKGKQKGNVAEDDMMGDFEEASKNVGMMSQTIQSKDHDMHASQLDNESYNALDASNKFNAMYASDNITGKTPKHKETEESTNKQATNFWHSKRQNYTKEQKSKKQNKGKKSQNSMGNLFVEKSKSKQSIKQQIIEQEESVYSSQKAKISNGINVADIQQEKLQEEELKIAQVALVKEKLANIKREKIRQRRSVFIQSFSLVLLLSCYFVISYFLSTRAFNQVPQILSLLSTIYYKDGCLTLLIGVMRQNMIRNELMTLFGEAGTSYSTLIVAYCYQYNDAYRQMEQDIPPAFGEITTFIEQVETDQLCDLIYPGNQSQIVWCQSAYNGLLQYGLYNAVNVIYDFYQKIEVEFRTENRTNDTLKAFLNDTTSAALIDLKSFVIAPIFDTQKTETTNSAKNYLAKLITEYMILYVIFLALLFILIIIFTVVMFRKIKDYLWKTNLLMKVLPIQMLPKNKLQDLKEFFSSQ